MPFYFCLFFPIFRNICLSNPKSFAYPYLRPPLMAFSRFLAALILLLLTTCWEVTRSSAQNFEQSCREAKVLVDILSQQHFAPIEIDDERSEKLFDRMIERLDRTHHLFHQQQLDALSKYRRQIDDDIRNQNCSFLRALSEHYGQALRQVDRVTRQLSKAPFDYQQALFLESTSSEQQRLPFAKDEEQLRLRWKKWLMYQSLELLYEEAPEALTSAGFLEKEAKARQRVSERLQCRLEQKIHPPGGIAQDVAQKFLEELVAQYDPHTAYFPPREQSGFLAALSKNAYSFGIGVKANPEGQIEVDELVPGGPAWKSNRLNEGDVLLEIKWESGEKTDLRCSLPSQVASLLENPKSSIMQLTVRKQNGQYEVVRLSRERMEVEENIITSIILEGNRRVGYIYLPAFYTERQSQGLANDVARELLKLKLERIEGLILDLRFNGGGAVEEALGLAGIFIDEGPITIVEGRGADLRVLKDRNRGTAYDGPLIIMMNNQSASASEIFAAAIQDYQRGLIVGSQSYGKSTGQLMLPIESGSMNPAFLKVTQVLYHRITGESHQQLGVTPDIFFPDPWQDWMLREKDLPESLSSTPQQPLTGFVPSPKIPIKELIQASRQRREKDHPFLLLQTYQNSLSEAISSSDPVPLRPRNFKDYQKQIEGLLEKVEAVEERPARAFQAKNNRFVSRWIQMDTYRKESNALLKEKIQHDIYLEEAYQIMLDLIRLTQN
jgi:carboxyl-terminal processing protease